MFQGHRTPGGGYRTTEARIIEAFPFAHLPTDEGPRLVRESCDELEE